jgi:signal transduction histidine kinase/HPt (histidine-containing phosphotransfer) domain-containing protein
MPPEVKASGAENILLKAGALQNAIFNSAHFSSIATDAGGVIQIFNVGAERMLGYTAAEVQGRITPADFSDPAELIERAQTLSLELATPILPGFEALVFKASRSIEDIYELTYIRKDGSRFPAMVSVTALRDAAHGIIGYLLIGTDNTARKLVEAEQQNARAATESASRAKSDFLASMSHEIRTPMNAIMGIADLLEATALSPVQETYLRILQRAGENLLNLINDMLDLSKAEASQLELERTGFSLHEQLDKMAGMVGPRATAKGLALSIHAADDIPGGLIGDPARLCQVLLNLLGNAIKFTGTGFVSLHVTVQPGEALPPRLQFCVTDSGIGIPVDKLEGVFERFSQADSSTTRRFGGSGLGLTICRQLVELMGGQIQVTSEPGKGSAFSFVLPFDLADTADDARDAPIDRSHDQAWPPLRILLAEDSPDNRAIVLAYLEAAPFVIDIAETGAVACARFEAGAYDLVLMDRQMPMMDGLTATRTIRAFEAAHQRQPTPIIALTASALKGDRDMCLAAGCTAFLTKPIRQAVLLRAIRDAITPAPTGAPRTAAQPIAIMPNPVGATMVDRFLFRCRANIAAMQSGLEKDDFGAVTTLGHQLCGAGTMFGFERLTEIGAGLECAGCKADAGASQAWLTAMTACLNAIEVNQPNDTQSRPGA